MLEHAFVRRARLPAIAFDGSEVSQALLALMLREVMLKFASGALAKTTHKFRVAPLLICVIAYRLFVRTWVFTRNCGFFVIGGCAGLELAGGGVRRRNNPLEVLMSCGSTDVSLIEWRANGIYGKHQICENNNPPLIKPTVTFSRMNARMRWLLFEYDANP